MKLKTKLMLSAAGFVGLGMLAAAMPAYAADTAIIMWNAANPGGAEAATGTGSADLVATNLDGITVTLSFVSRGTNPNGLTEGNINIDNTTDTVQTLNIIAGANGFLGNDSDFKLTGAIGVTLGSADLQGQFFADGADTLNGETTSVVGVGLNAFDSLGLTGPQSFAFNGTGFDALTGPYGLAEELSLTLQPGAGVFVQGVSIEAVPEPRTWVMMAGGFAMLGLLGYGRKVARYAI